MLKPIIGITPDVQLPDGNKIRSGRYYVSSAYIASTERAGGLPLMLPLLGETADIERHAMLIDGLLLSGGVDVNPLLYNEEPQRELGAVCDERDAYEVELVRIVRAMGKPVFGICRGIQLLNVACGGTLWQDIYSAGNDILKHRQEAESWRGSHTVFTEQGSMVRDLLGEQIVANSFHHQSCKKIAPGFTASSYSKDGIVEAIESSGGVMAFGVQWHPEHMTESQPLMLKLFRRLVEEAAAGA